MKQKLFATILPLTLLGMLLIAALAMVFIMPDQYGITIDEPGEDTYGQLVLSWYQTHGSDKSFLAYLPGSHMQEHGAIVEVLAAAAEQTFGNTWHSRAVVNALTAFVGILAIALCGFELGGWWGALLAALSLWLYPRFFGAMFNNSRDIPYTSSIALVLWAVLLLMRQWERKWRYLLLSILAGFMIGLSIAIRVTSIFWFPILGLLLAGWWLEFGRRAFKEKREWSLVKAQIFANLQKQVFAAILIGIVSCATILALWPFVAVNPVHNMLDAIKVMSKYSWNGMILFEGQLHPATALPRRYAPVWLIIGSPPAVVIFAAIGGLIACIKLIVKRVIEPKVVLISLAFLVPLGTIIALRPTLYDGMRHFLFVVPPLLLLAVYGFMNLFTFLVQKKQVILAVALVLLALVSQAQVVKDMYDLHPYEYMYFSPFIGGVPGAKGQYEIDYWGLCNKPSAEWLAQHYTQYTTSPTPSVNTPYEDRLVTSYLPAVFRPVSSNADFYISITRFGFDKLNPSYKVIHTEVVQGYTACVVKVKPSSGA